jgi:hypothetical protein
MKPGVVDVRAPGRPAVISTPGRGRRPHARRKGRRGGRASEGRVAGLTQPLCPRGSPQAAQAPPAGMAKSVLPAAPTAERMRWRTKTSSLASHSRSRPELQRCGERRVAGGYGTCVCAVCASFRCQRVARDRSSPTPNPRRRDGRVGSAGSSVCAAGWSYHIGHSTPGSI